MSKLLGLLLAGTVFAAVPQALAQEKLTLWFNKGFYPAEDEALNKVIAGFEPTEVAPPATPAAPGTGGIKGRRPSKKDKLRAAAAVAEAEAAAEAARPRGKKPPKPE